MDLNKILQDEGFTPVATPFSQIPKEEDIENGKVVEPVVEPEPEKKVEPPVFDKVKFYSEEFGQEFKDEEEVNTFKSSLTSLREKATEYDTKMPTLTEELEALRAGVNPREFFASDELFIFNGLMKKFPDKNASVLSDIITTDYSKTYMEDPATVLAKELMLEKPKIYKTFDDAREDVFARFGVDETNVDENENIIIDPKVQRRMQADAENTIGKFDALKKEITLPQNVDLTARLKEKTDTENIRIKKITEATEPLFKELIPQRLKAIVFEETLKEDGKEVTNEAFKYEIGDSFLKSKPVQELLTAFRQQIIQNATEFDKKTESKMLDSLTDQLEGMYLSFNKKEIFAAIRDDVVAKQKDENWVKRHNPRPLKQDATPQKKTESQQAISDLQEKELKRLNIKV